MLRTLVLGLASLSVASATFIPTFDVDGGTIATVGNPYLNQHIKILPGTIATVAFEDWIDNDYDDAYLTVSFSQLNLGTITANVVFGGALSAWSATHYGVFLDQNNYVVATSLASPYGTRTFGPEYAGMNFQMALVNPLVGVFRLSGSSKSWVSQVPMVSETPEPASLAVVGMSLLALAQWGRKRLTRQHGGGRVDVGEQVLSNK